MIVDRSSTPGRRRRGLGIVEMAMTGVLVAAAMAATLQVVGWLALQRRAAERRERAIVAASNLIEQIKIREWNDLKTEALAAVKLDDATAKFLHGSTLKLDVEPFEDAPSRKKITVEIAWPDRSGRLEAPVRLVSWSYRRGGSGQ
jgi:hypothetical protein